MSEEWIQLEPMQETKSEITPTALSFPIHGTVRVYENNIDTTRSYEREGEVLVVLMNQRTQKENGIFIPAFGKLDRLKQQTISVNPFLISSQPCENGYTVSYSLKEYKDEELMRFVPCSRQLAELLRAMCIDKSPKDSEAIAFEMVRKTLEFTYDLLKTQNVVRFFFQPGDWERFRCQETYETWMLQPKNKKANLWCCIMN